ncbi:uncharacterized protein LOC144579547 [Callithrix jacchus]
MSHTPILVFGLRSRPLFPLGGGNAAALQHEGRVVVRRGQESPFGPKEGVAGHLRAATARARPEWRARGDGGGGALNGRRDSLHRPCCAEAAPGRGTRSPAWRGGSAWGPQREAWGPAGREQWPSRDSWAPGGCPRDQGGDPAPQAGADRARRDTGRFGFSGGRKLVPGRLGSWSPPLSTWAASPQGRPREGRISGTAVAAPGGREGGGGRLARRLGRGLEAPGWVRRSLHRSRPMEQAQAAPDEAGNFPTWWGKYQNKRPSGASARPPQPSPPPARPPPAPTARHDLRRPLHKRAARIWRQDATTGSTSLAATAASAYLASAGRHSDSD